jgi:hypothetical protein
MGDAVELRFEPASDRFDAFDDRWLDQVGTFVVELDQEVGGVTRRREPVPGTKGTIDSILLTVGSAGVLTGAMDFARAWLGRDGSRKLRISWSDGGALETVEVSGQNIDSAALRSVVQAVTAQLDAAP